MFGALSHAPRRRGAHSVWVAALAALAVLLLLAWPERANAQISITSKTLCDASQPTCPPSASLSAVSLGQPVAYEVTINGAGGTSVDLKDTLPAGFQLTGVVCNGNPMPTAALVANLTLNSNGVTICRFNGYFGAGSTSSASNLVEVFGPNNALLDSKGHNAIIRLNSPLPTDLKITKTANLSSIDVSGGPQLVTYTITLENLGASDVYLGGLLEIQDRLSLKTTSVALNASLVSASCALGAGSTLSDCLTTAPLQPYSYPVLVGYAGPHDFAKWGYPATGPGSAGFLKVGEKVVLTVVVQVSKVANLDCILPNGSDGYFQAAHLVFTGPGGTATTTFPDFVAANNTAQVPLDVVTGATIVDPLCNAPFQPKLQISKIQSSPAPSSIVQWNTGTVDYTLTVQNVSTTHTIRNIQLVDLTEEAIGTPPFLATPLSQTCPATVCTTPPTLTAQQLPGYGLAMPVLNAVLFDGSAGLLHSTSQSFTLKMQYSNPKCDSFRDGAIDPIRNHIRVTGWDEEDDITHVVTTVTLAIPLDYYVTTNMQEAPACPLLVTKTPTNTGPFAPPRILFNTPYSYTVTFENPDPVQSFTVGTLIDTLRFSPVTPAYAISLKVDYQFQCVSMGTGTVSGGFPGANPNGFGSWDTVYIVANSLPQQGVRLIQNSGPVTFDPQSKLVCTVIVNVYPPAPSDPYCGLGQLDNAAILDMSTLYNPNLPWSTTPGTTNMWAMVSKPLPACFNWAVNKFVSPAWTTPGGGPLQWNYTIYNGGPSMTGGGPLVHDKFFDGNGVPLGVTVASYNDGCNMGGCLPMPGWFPNPVAAGPGGTAMQIPYTLANTQILTTTFNVPNAPPSVVHGGKVCNRVTASLPNLGTGAYWKNPNTLQAQACALILDVGFVKVTKLLTNNTGIVVPTSFAATLNCTYPGITLPVVPLALTAGGSVTVPNIPIGSSCSVIDSPPVPAGTATCAFPVWQVFTTPLSPFTTSMQVGGTTNVTLRNTLGCRPVGSIRILKSTILPKGVPPLPPGFTFSFSVACSPLGPNTNVAVPANGSITIPNVPIVSTCTITETLPPSNLRYCTWTSTPSPIPTITVNVPNATTTIKVTNKLVCTGRIVVNKTTTAPLGVTLPPTILFNVNCSPGGAFTTTAPLNGQSPILVVPAPATCSVTEQVPAVPPGCTWSVAKSPPGNVFVAPGTLVTVNVTNKLTCKPGRLVIKKVTIHPVPQTPFTFSVNCTPGGPNTMVTVPSNGSAVLNNIPTTATCTIVEQPHAAPAGCTWVATYAPPSPVTIPPGATVTVTVTNKLVCSPSGELIVKKVTIPSPIASMFVSIPIDVDCNPGGPHNSLTLPANGQVSVGSIAGGSSCAVTEHLPVLANPNCQWVGTAAPSNPVTVPAGATVTMTLTNTVVCSQPGRLLIQKGTTGPPGVPLPASILFNVNCTPGGPTTTITAPANAFSSPLNVPGGSTCTVTEQVPPAPAGCTWSATQIPPGNVVVAAGATVVVTFLNKLVCIPPPTGDGTLLVRKLVMVNGSRVPVSPSTLPAAWNASFPFTIACGANAPMPGRLDAGNNYQATAAIPVGVGCTVQEQTPDFPIVNCRWSVMYPQGQTATLATSGGTATINIYNDQVCATGSLTLKKVVEAPPGVVSSLPSSFLFSVNCAGRTPFDVGVPTSPLTSFGVAVPAPVTCTVSEQVPPAPPSCSWTTSQSPPGGVVVTVPAGIVGVTITNKLVCTP